MAVQPPRRSSSTPTGVALDDSGHLFVSDWGNNRIRQVNLATGIITTVAGDGVMGYSGDGGPATSAKLSGPEGLAIDRKGGAYIADYGNNRVRYLGSATSGIATINTAAESISVYPNPSSGIFTLYLPAAASGQVSIAMTNTLGKK